MEGITGLVTEKLLHYRNIPLRFPGIIGIIGATGTVYQPGFQRMVCLHCDRSARCTTSKRSAEMVIVEQVAGMGSCYSIRNQQFSFPT